jgi:NAD(P)H-hydrate epimerase
MELAGLSCALAIQKHFQGHGLILVGPGNNGGDALVCARYLCHFGYQITIHYPIQTKKPLFIGLVEQLKDLEIEFVDKIDISKTYDFIVDGIFGFGFNGAIRSPFDLLISFLMDTMIPIISIDIPSGWQVQSEENNGFYPAMLISLTLPKLCAKTYTGIHYIGGRFISTRLANDLQLEIPKYGSELILRL